jgi:hypothetical protein
VARRRDDVNAKGKAWCVRVKICGLRCSRSHNSIGVAEISAFNLGRNAALARVCPIRESKP